MDLQRHSLSWLVLRLGFLKSVFLSVSSVSLCFDLFTSARTKNLLGSSAEFAGPFWLGLAQEIRGIAGEHWLISRDKDGNESIPFGPGTSNSPGTLTLKTFEHTNILSTAIACKVLARCKSCRTNKPYLTDN